MPISFKLTRAESALVNRIVDRTMEMAAQYKIRYPRMDAMMDVTATHANGCPLDLERLLTFPDFDFAHDVFGILRHIDRRTGELKNCFLPRCARPEKVAA